MQHKVLLVVVSAAILQAVLAHVCILDPPQRGPMSISSPGDHNCYRPYGECGNQPSESPKVTWIAGSKQRILFQQALNHWYPQRPGWLDAGLSFNKFDNLTSTDFAPWGNVIPDFNANTMITQTNFTIEATVPQVTCDHCVLRVRYVSNNPDEAVKNNPNAIFYQCVDVKIIKA
jgi:hypothetical protein